MAAGLVRWVIFIDNGRGIGSWRIFIWRLQEEDYEFSFLNAENEMFGKKKIKGK
jgi:hypothetical protein